MCLRGRFRRAIRRRRAGYQWQCRPVQEGMQITGRWRREFATSRAGTAAYLGGGAQPSNRPLSWLDSRGTVTPIASELGIWGRRDLRPMATDSRFRG